MISFVLFIGFVIAPLDASPPGSHGCSVSLNGDLSEPQPLVLVKKTRNTAVDFVNPIDIRGTLRFRHNEEFRLACPGARNYLVGVGHNDVQDIAAFCVSGKTFSVNSVEYEFRDLVCKTLPSSVVRKTRRSCGGGHSEVEIGFQLKNEFLRTIEVCRDDNMYTTIYTKCKLTKSIKGFQKSFRRPIWRKGNNLWGTYDVNNRYNRKVQKATVSQILGSTALGERYISDAGDYYFSRGHLVAKSDLVYGTAHSSTFWYVNSHPQWQIFNGGNWNSLENDVRAFASSKKLDLDVWTGTHGIMTLPDVNNVEQPLYLYASGSDRGLPIPLYFWKIIYDPITRKGTAFVGVNNPYITKSPADYHICEDISRNGRFPWLTWSANDIPLGISYVCTIEDLRRVVRTLPPLTVVGILE